MANREQWFVHPYLELVTAHAADETRKPEGGAGRAKAVNQAIDEFLPWYDHYSILGWRVPSQMQCHESRAKRSRSVHH
jgi:hypothetical protein